MSLAVAPAFFVPTAARVAFRRVGPGWFTSVMGTGILGIGLELAPVDSSLVRTLARAVFALDVVLFAAFAALFALKMLVERGALRATLDDVAVAQTWGAPPMAAFTVASGFLIVGETMAPVAVCVAIAQALYVAGVALSIASAGAVPFRMFTSHEIPPNGAVGSWLLPVVPPIVASVPAALLSATWPPAARSSMLALGFALLGTGVALAAIVIVVFYARLVYAKVPESALVTTTWLVVGPLGQFVAGIVALAVAAGRLWPEFAPGLAAASVALGMLVWGFGVYWLAMAIALTLRAAAKRFPFTLGWWAFTFPVGTLMSGSYALARETHAAVFTVAGLALLTLLAGTWTLVAVRSLRLARAALAEA